MAYVLKLRRNKDNKKCKVENKLLFAIKINTLTWSGGNGCGFNCNQKKANYMIIL